MKNGPQPWLLSALIWLAGTNLVLAKPITALQELRGIVGDTVSVSLPTKGGVHWGWRSEGAGKFFALPYLMQFQPSSASSQIPMDVWVFPLIRPGSTVIEFLPTVASTRAQSKMVKRVRLHVLTPYEAQQYPLSQLLDALLIH